MSEMVICKHAAKCAETGDDALCWHSVAHAPFNYQSPFPVPPCDCQTEMKCTATGKMCRCLPVFTGLTESHYARMGMSKGLNPGRG